MSLKERVEATAKNIEGHLQEALGNLTGDVNAQVEGREKQLDSNIRHTIESVKDAIHEEEMMDVKERLDATTKNVEGHLQETFGDITGDPQMQTEGQLKQVEATVRHKVQDVKDELK
jgi:uncharacterized protein YjbJ (UPF0337 family)